MDLSFVDRYTYRARLVPSLLTFLPLAFGGMIWFPGQEATWKVVGVILVSSGGATLLSHFGRDLGAKKQNELFRLWGGVPTNRLLSHRLTRFDEVTLGRYHAKLKYLIPELQIPNAVEEMKNPSHAAQIYDSAIAFLREKTRDQKVFPVVFAENVNYGFRRNLLGWKPVGIGASSLGLMSCAVFAATHFRDEQSVTLLSIAGAIVSATLLILWLFVIRPRWVRYAADAYAERLVRSLDAL
jgi:hypothetical protein